MELLCKDSDLLRYEPTLFTDCGLMSQTNCRGDGGELLGGSFTADGADFVGAGVTVGQVVHLYSRESGFEATLEIAAVSGPGELVLRFPQASSDDTAVCDLAGNGLEYRIVSYAIQIAEVTSELTGYFGLRPGDGASEYGLENVLDDSDLRRTAIFATLAGIFATLGPEAGNETGNWEKSLYYQRKFEKARECCLIRIDAEGDGTAEKTIPGGVFRLKRG